MQQMKYSVTCHCPFYVLRHAELRFDADGLAGDDPCLLISQGRFISLFFQQVFAAYAFLRTAYEHGRLVGHVPVNDGE